MAHKARRMSKKTLSIIICAAIVLSCGVGFGAAYAWINGGGSLNRSLANNSSEKVSEPFNYSGYSTAEYTSYTKTSEYVEMDDGVKIAVDIYLPAGSENDAKAFPTVFQFTPYGRAFTIPEELGLKEKLTMKIGVGTATNEIDRANSHDSVYGSSDTIVQTLLSYGYAYVCADVRGTGASYGTKVDFMPEMATDGKQLIDWMAQQEWCDGNVGMFGGSYLGYTQLVIAAEQPTALKAIFPEVVAFDGYSSEISPGGVFVQLYSDEDIQTLYEMNNYFPDDYVYPTTPVIDEDGDGELWDEIPLDLNGNGDFLDDYNYPEDPNDEPQYADGNKREHIYYLATYEHKDNLPYSSIGKMAEYIDTDVNYTVKSSGQEYNLTAYTVSPAANIDKIMETDIAIYNHGSWMDTFITGTTQLYNTAKDTNPSKMVIDVGYHENTSPFWEYNNEDESESIDAYAIELVRYYDRYLKGIENGIDKEDPVYIYNMNGDGWRFEKEFPLSRQVETDYYFSENNLLSTSKSMSGKDNYKVDLTHDSSFKSKWYDYGVSRYVMADPDDLPYRTEADKKCLTYTTSAFLTDTEVTGYPIMSIFASSTSKDADFHVYLEDVDEKGNAVLVTEGVLRAGFAKTYDNDTMLPGKNVNVLPELPWHGYEEGQYNANIFANDSIVELTFELFPTSWTFKKGHSLRISIACADSPTFEQNGEVNENTNVTVYRDSDHPSKVTLPIIPKS